MPCAQPDGESYNLHLCVLLFCIVSSTQAVTSGSLILSLAITGSVLIHAMHDLDSDAAYIDSITLDSSRCHQFAESLPPSSAGCDLHASGS